MLCCPGSSQDRVTFCCNWEGAWLGPGCYSIYLTLLLGAEERDSLLGRRGSFQSRKQGWGTDLSCIVYYERLVFACEPYLFCTFCHFCCCCCLVFCLIAVFSRLFLSRPLVFAFCAPNSPLHSVAVWMGRGKSRRERESSVVWRVSLRALKWVMPLLNLKLCL